MSIPAHTNARGHSWSQSYFVNEHMVYDGPGMTPVGPFQQAFAYSDGYNFKQGQVGDFKNPTPYTRHVRRLLANEPWVFRQQERYSNGQNYLTQVWTKSLLNWFDPMYVAWPTQFDLEVADALAKAKTKALEKLSANKVQYGVSVLEARRTASMIATNVHAVFEGIKAFKRGYGLVWLQDLVRDRELAKRWLELQYGWKPLLADIHGGAEYLNRGMLSDDFQLEVKSAPRVYLQTPWTVNGGTEVRWTCRGRAKVRLIANVRSSYLETFNTLGLLNPAEIVWELVPFSFIVDWFTPIGSVLSSLSASAGLDLSSRSQLHYSKEGIFEVRGLAQPFNGYQGVDQKGYLRVGVHVFDRTPLYGAWPMPELYNKANPFSTPHILNAIALCGARF